MRPNGATAVPPAQSLPDWRRCDVAQPENYADASYARSFARERDRAEVQRDIEQHLQRLAERGLPAGESLKIEVLDIDLAGQFEPFRFRNGTDVRIRAIPAGGSAWIPALARSWHPSRPPAKRGGRMGPALENFDR